MTDWKFRKERWDTYKLGLSHGKKQITREDNMIPERLRRSYIDGYSKGCEIRRAK